MLINYEECFWGDSTLDKIEISNDRINITVYNDVLQKNIFIDCLQCVGMTEFINWDENIIENIFVKELTDGQHPMVNRISQLYGENSYDYEKNIEGKFMELNIVLINEFSFSVICKNIEFGEV